MKLHALLSERPVAYYPVLRKIAGSIEAAILLQYLIERCDENATVCKTVREITEDTLLSEYEQKKAISLLKRKVLLRTERRGMPAKRYFILNIDEIIGRIMDER